MMGLRLKSSEVAMRAASSSSHWKERAELPSLSQSFRAENTSTSWRNFLSPLAAFWALSMRRSTISTSAMISSMSMTPMSPTGSTGTLVLVSATTCMMFSSSKQRTTWTMAAHSRMLARNLLPRPWPWLAPLTRPAMSTNSTTAGVVFLGWYISLRASRRWSGTATTPTLGSMVQKG